MWNSQCAIEVKHDECFVEEINRVGFRFKDVVSDSGKVPIRRLERDLHEFRTIDIDCTIQISRVTEQDGVMVTALQNITTIGSSKVVRADEVCDTFCKFLPGAHWDLLCYIVAQAPFSSKWYFLLLRKHRRAV